MPKYTCALFLFFCFPFLGCVQKIHTDILNGTATNTERASITVDKVKQLVNNKAEFTLIDSRSHEEYTKSHLPSAISMPACEGKNHLDQLPEEKNQLLVFYCGWPGCSMNDESAAVAAQTGHENIMFMNDGLEKWIQTGLPTIATDDFVQNGNCIIIDLRPARKNTVQRVPRSISIPSPELSEQLNTLSKEAAIVLYSDHAQESRDALAQFRSAGFDTIAMVEGNFKGWKQRGNPITSGPVVTTTNWTKKKGKGKVTLAEFKRALAGRIDAILLDVRTNQEVATGKLPETLHIPLEDLTEREDELPKDKKIYIHCTNGSRADMASRILREDGYTTFALHATLKCDKGGCELLD